MQVGRLVCAFVVNKPQRQVFLCRGPFTFKRSDDLLSPLMDTFLGCFLMLHLIFIRSLEPLLYSQFTLLKILNQICSFYLLEEFDLVNSKYDFVKQQIHFYISL